LLIENATTGKRYGLISHAILDASPGDALVLDPATYHESIDFRGKPLTITSLNPEDPEIVAATVVEGAEGGPAAVFSARENAGCVLAGLTLVGRTAGISCRDAAPVIRNCTLQGTEGTAVEFWTGFDPMIVDCNTVGIVAARPFVENMTIARRYASIQEAIDEALDGQELVLCEGAYFEDVRLKGKGLTLRSTDPADTAVVESTIISGTARAVTFADSEDVNCVVSGLTIADANEGMYCAGASPTITSCRIVGNTLAGILLWGGSNPRITNCLIADNPGAGVRMEPDLQGRTAYYSYPDIINCTIVGNLDAGVLTGRPTIANSIIYFNGSQIVGESATVTYSDVQGGFVGEGNIDTDPLFADLGAGDYHLESQTGRWDPVSRSLVTDEVTSPCIDAGDPGAMVGDEPEPNGGRVNMGAYGGTREASKSQ
jgi:parallel beta-helix repeat protein